MSEHLIGTSLGQMDNMNDYMSDLPQVLPASVEPFSGKWKFLRGHFIFIILIAVVFIYKHILDSSPSSVHLNIYPVIKAGVCLLRRLLTRIKTSASILIALLLSLGYLNLYPSMVLVLITGQRKFHFRTRGAFFFSFVIDKFFFFVFVSLLMNGIAVQDFN